MNEGDMGTVDRRTPVKVPQHVQDTLRSHSIFSKTAEQFPEQFRQLMSSLTQMDVEQGNVFMKQGDRTRHYYIIESGICQVWIDKLGTEMMVSQLGEGRSFGELSFLYDQPRAATIIAETPCRLWKLHQDSIEQFVNAVPPLKMQIQQKKFLRNVIMEHYAFSHIDDAYIREELISKFNLEHYSDKSVVIEQNEPPTPYSKFYVIVSGAVEVIATKGKDNPSVVATLRAGQSFGELTLLYNQPRSATIRCIGPTTLLTLRRDDFKSLVMRGSTSLLNLFEKFCSQSKDGYKFMTFSDFVEALTPFGDSEKYKISREKLRIIFELADKTGSKNISFAEFALITSILLKDKNPEYSIAFHFADTDNDGRISGKDFESAIRQILHSYGMENTADVDLEQMGLSDVFKEDYITYEEFRDMCQRKKDLHKAFREFVDFWQDLHALSLSYLHSVVDLNDDLFNISLAHEGTEKLKHTTYKYLIAGGIAGAISRTLVSPLIRLKMIMQTQKNPPVVTGILQGFRHMYSKDGFRGFFRGNGTNVVRIAPTTAFQFYFFETYKKLILDFRGKSDLNAGERLIAGGFAGITAATLTYPLDFIRARLTVQSGSAMKYNGIVHGLTTVVRESGFTALYRGLWPTLVGVFPYIGIDFAVYGTLKPYAPKIPGTEQTTSLGLLVCGGLAGIVSQTVAFPLELIRRRLQVEGFIDTPYKYNGGIYDALKKTVEIDGVKGLYRGITPNYLKSAPSIGIGFLVYEKLKHYFNLA